MGWTWVSINVNPEQSNPFLEQPFSQITDGIIIRKHPPNADFVEQRLENGEWDANTEAWKSNYLFDPEFFYEVYFPAKSQQISFTGTKIFEINDFKFNKGWNEIPALGININAFQNDIFEDGDTLKGQNYEYAKYISPTGWFVFAGEEDDYGSGFEMKEGLGYKLFTYQNRTVSFKEREDVDTSVDGSGRRLQQNEWYMDCTDVVGWESMDAGGVTAKMLTVQLKDKHNSIITHGVMAAFKSNSNRMLHVCPQKTWSSRKWGHVFSLPMQGNPAEEYIIKWKNNTQSSIEYTLPGYGHIRDIDPLHNFVEKRIEDESPSHPPLLRPSPNPSHPPLLRPSPNPPPPPSPFRPLQIGERIEEVNATLLEVTIKLDVDVESFTKAYRDKLEEHLSVLLNCSLPLCSINIGGISPGSVLVTVVITIVKESNSPLPESDTESLLSSLSDKNGEELSILFEMPIEKINIIPKREGKLLFIVASQFPPPFLPSPPTLSFPVANSKINLRGRWLIIFAFFTYLTSIFVFCVKIPQPKRVKVNSSDSNTRLKK